MAKFGMYTKGTNEVSQHISVVDLQSKAEAEAYFAGRKQLSLVQLVLFLNEKNLMACKQKKTKS